MVSSVFISVKDYGAVGNGIADDKTAIQNAVNAAIATPGTALLFPPGTYKLSGFVDINAASGLTLRGSAFATIRYQSDDTNLVAGGVAASDAMARSGFLLRNSTNVKFESLQFQGGTASQITTTNIGCGIYATASSRITLENCRGLNGYSLFVQDATVSDYDTKLINCSSYGCRGPVRTGRDGVIAFCHFEQPGIPDTTGTGDSFSISGSTVTLTDAAGRFRSEDNGRLIRIAGATSPENNGLCTLTYISATQVSWTNASGVTETFSGSWFILGGDKVGKGAGASAISVSAGVVTFTASTAMFDSNDLNKVIRITHASKDANDGQYRIKEVVSSTVVKYDNASAVSEDYAEGFSVDGYDNKVEGGNTYGSTHAIYQFAGRINTLVEGCTFRNIRTTPFKVSGSSLPIRGATMRNCYVEECGSVCIYGADDAQEHEQLSLINNVIVDCATGRKGWSESVGAIVLGARNVRFAGNQFLYTRNSIRSVDGSFSLAGMYAMQAARYVEGASQPIEDIVIEGNTFSAVPQETNILNLLNAAISFEQVGLLQRHGIGTLAKNKNDNTITLTSTTSLFHKSLIGASIEIVNSTGSNDGSFTITGVPAANQVTYINTGGGAGSGTYRIGAAGGKSGGIAHLTKNEILSVAPTGILCKKNVAPTLVDNVFRGCQVNVQFEGDVSPVFIGNREIGRASDTAGIRFNGGDDFVSWPIVGKNYITNNAIGPSRGWGMQIGVNNGTPRDFPLLGTHGRCRPSDGKEEVVISWGAGHVDGDTVTVNGVTYTYKASAPTGNQFNSFAGLVALIAGLCNAQTGIDCADYGTGFTDSAGTAANVTTQHLRIRRNVASTNSDGTLQVQTVALYPTALVMLPNQSPNTTCGGRGSQSGASPDRTVVWSQMCAFDDCPSLVADNAAAQAVIIASGYRKLDNVNGYDGGSNHVMAIGITAGTEQWRWKL